MGWHEGWRRACALAWVSAAWAVLGSATATAQQTLEVAPGDDLQAAWNALQPGDELLLGGGTYELSGRLSMDVVGTEAAPITIAAKPGEQPHLHREGADQNILDIDMAEHVTLRGIELSGGSAGIRISGARFLTIEDCEIHDTGDVALRANDTGVVYESLSILRNHIHHTNNTGEGMYLGCNDDGCQVANALIEGNYVHHTNQASVEQGDGIELKEGSYGNTVRDNVIHDTNYPCILTYSTAGNGPPNVIERNLLYNCGDHAIQSAADAIIRNNVILSAASDGIAMQPHQSGTPGNLIVVHNTVLDADGDALSLSGATGSVVIANNALYTMGATALRLDGTLDMVSVSGNVVQGGVSGFGGMVATGDLDADFVAASFAGAPPIDAFPSAAGALVGAGDPAQVVEHDFNGTARDGAADVGAYAFDADGNPGWTLAPGFKDQTASDPGEPPAAGSGGTGSAGSGATGSSDAGRGGAEAGTAGAGAAGRGGSDAASGVGGGGGAAASSTGGGGSASPSAGGKKSDGGCRASAHPTQTRGDALLAGALALVALRSRLRRARPTREVDIRLRRAWRPATMGSASLRWLWVHVACALLGACASSAASTGIEPRVAEPSPSQSAPAPPPPAAPKPPSAYEQRWQTACTDPGALGRCPAPFDRPGVFFDAKGSGQYAPPGLCGVVVEDSDRATHAALEPKRKALRACFRGAPQGAWVDVASDGSREAAASPELPARTVSCVAGLVKRTLPSKGPSSVKRVVVLSVGSPRHGQPPLSKESVNAMITSHAEEVSACYDGALEVWPGLRGRLAPSVVIWFDGSVALVRTEESSLDNPALECCINTAVRAWRFGPPEDGNIAIVSLPLLLGPQP